ncbi:MAG: YebC/PmpR family DNA-binding transcriptional regulator [Patescibacteria group bacterium]|nr:YebC/PmpR family DNA-binding transcriptional regulator [Patescibacteria group bacterium]
MSGHSKWSTIKHKKAATDAKRGALFSKIARIIEVAAKGGADPEMNFRLKLAVQKAKAANMPAINIEKAIQKGAGLGKDASSIEEVVYEGLGPGNVAIMINALTDNRNRTVAELRNIFAKTGGNLGSSGSVAWQFVSRGVLVVPKKDEETELKLIDAGAVSYEDLGDSFEVHTEPKDLNKVKQTLATEGLEAKDAKLAMVPTSMVKVSDPAVAKKILNLMDALDDHEDVTEVFANFDIDDEILNNLS